MSADPPAPTADDLRAALALIDRVVVLDVTNDGDVIEAALEVARATIARDHACVRLSDPAAPWFGDERAELRASLNTATVSYRTALADLVALAKEPTP